MQPKNRPDYSGRSDEYNDVRVNRLSLAALRVLKKPLPSVLKDRIMDPIGASSSWSWNGYSTSFVDLNGEQVQSVSGGGHWVRTVHSFTVSWMELASCGGYHYDGVVL